MNLCDKLIYKYVINNRSRSRIEGESYIRIYCENITLVAAEIAIVRRRLVYNLSFTAVYFSRSIKRGPITLLWIYERV